MEGKICCRNLGLALLLVLASGQVMAANAFKKMNLHPYFGVEYDYMHIKNRNDWRKILSANFNCAGAFAGLKFYRYFGLEVAYYKTLKNSQEQAVLTDFNDFPNNGITATVARTQYKGFNFDANFYIPLDPKFNLNLVIGAQTLHPNLQITATGTTNLANAMNVIKGRNYTALRLGGGFEYVETHWGARGRIMWIDTRGMTLNIENAQSFFPQITKYAFNQTLGVNIGVFYMF